MKIINYLKGYFKPLPILGGLIGSGIFYWSGFCITFLKETTINFLPTISNGNYQQLLYNSLQSAYSSAAQLGLVGGINGLLFTRHGLDYLVKKFRIKRR